MQGADQGTIQEAIQNLEGFTSWLVYVSTEAVQGLVQRAVQEGAVRGERAGRATELEENPSAQRQKAAAERVAQRL